MLDLKGIWIPYEILTDDKLNDKEKIIYSLILYLCKNNKECYCTNKTLMDLLKISKSQSTRLIKSLKDKNYIDVKLKVKEDGKKVEYRAITPLVKHSYTGSTNATTGSSKYDTSMGSKYAYNNKIYNKNNNKISVYDLSFNQRHYTEEDFEKLYAN